MKSKCKPPWGGKDSKDTREYSRNNETYGGRSNSRAGDHCCNPGFLPAKCSYHSRHFKQRLIACLSWITDQVLALV